MDSVGVPIRWSHHRRNLELVVVWIAPDVAHVRTLELIEAGPQAQDCDPEDS